MIAFVQKFRWHSFLGTGTYRRAGLGCWVAIERGDTGARRNFCTVTVRRAKNSFDRRFPRAFYTLAFAFLPGPAGGVYPDIRHSSPSIGLPSRNRIERHTTTSPLADSSGTLTRTFASEIPRGLPRKEFRLGCSIPRSLLRGCSFGITLPVVG